MGWASGSGILDGVLKATWRYVPQYQKMAVARALIKVFEQEDCDTLHECFSKKWPELEQAYKAMYPHLFEDEE